MERRLRYLIAVFSAVIPFVLGLLLMFTNIYVLGDTTNVGLVKAFHSLSRWMIAFGFLTSMISVCYIGVVEAFSAEDNELKKLSEKELKYIMSIREKVFIEALDKQYRK